MGRSLLPVRTVLCWPVAPSAPHVDSVIRSMTDSEPQRLGARHESQSRLENFKAIFWGEYRIRPHNRVNGIDEYGTRTEMLSKVYSARSAEREHACINEKRR
eukprot:gb/GECG01003077.1/.p1 GENE.gb/GECG01003077.1/~~gb/GECG01003077.1/.p1  ORF type:complete len:102 (+),score=6.80 gb/GECG01003077.1/:1-306(+)